MKGTLSLPNNLPAEHSVAKSVLFFKVPLNLPFFCGKNAVCSICSKLFPELLHYKDSSLKVSLGHWPEVTFSFLSFFSFMVRVRA